LLPLLNWQAGTYEFTFILFTLKHSGDFSILCRYRRNDIGDDDDGDVQVGLQLKVESRT